MDFTQTLTESLLDDLDDLSDTEELTNTASSNESYDTGGVGLLPTNKKEDGVSNGKSGGYKESKKRSVEFAEDPRLQSHLASISELTSTSEEDGYTLMTTSNKYLASIQNVLNRAHADLATAYKPKFPELEELVIDPIAYKNAVQVIQNEMDLSSINEQLNSVAKLSSNQIITLSVASSTTSGMPLTQPQLQHVNECIQYIDRLLDIKARLINHLEQHMKNLAPNICALIGPTLAARMVATAGGMAELTRIPSCNLQVLGQIKNTGASRAGMSTNIISATAASSAVAGTSASNVFKPHEGILSECELYNCVPAHLQRKALKVIAAKLALVIRCDYVNLESGRARTNTSGLKFRSDIEKKFVKWDEPDNAPVVKALPNVFSFGTKFIVWTFTF